MSIPDGGRLGLIDRIVGIIKGLTFTNVAVIAILFMLIAPAWLAWRIMNDEGLQTLLFSSFEELPIAQTECGLRRAVVRGQGETWFISHDFRHSGRDRWYVGVNPRFFSPTDPEAVKAYCDTLTAIIDHLHDITDPDLKFPGSNRLVFPQVSRSRVDGKTGDQERSNP